MKRKVNLAVIGTGRMGGFHTRNIVRAIPEANLMGICDIRLDVAQAVADELEIDRVVKDYHELLEDKNIEAVLIATTTNTHAFIMKDAAKAGKHIFCEKPLDMDIKVIDDALDVIDKAGVKLQVGFNRRFDKNFNKVRETVNSGEIGRPCIVKISSYDPEVPDLEFMRDSGGMFLDMSIHDFDMARYQAGDVEEVYAIGGVLIEPELKKFGDSDTNIITLKFANGAIGVIDNSRQAVYGYDQRLEVFCSNGTAMAGNEVESTIKVGRPGGFYTDKLPHFFMQRYLPGYLEEIRTFLECVRDDKPTPVSGKDGRAAVVIGHAAGLSFRENRPVKISEVENNL